MVADKGKKAKLAPEDELDDQLLLSIEKLQDLQDHLEKVNEEANDKVLEVEQKYNEIRRPVYVKRNDVIKSIPDFWLTAFLSHPALGDLLSEEDQKIFKYLDSLDVEDFKDLKSGYSITFNFIENPYFEDAKLTKTFTFSDEGTTEISGTTINWKQGMAAAVNGANNEKKGSKRPLPEQSFFSWFSEIAKDIEELQDEVGEIIKEDLWPNPLKYFNNEADEEDSVGDVGDGGDDMENGNDDDDKEEDDEDDDDDDDDEEE